MYEILLGRKEKEIKKYGMEGTVLIGKQYVKMAQTTSLSTNIYMDVAKAHIMFICGKRGSGKSYAMGAIAEGVMDLPPKIAQNISMIILDTMGIYWTMKYPNKKDEKLLDEWDLKARGMDVQIFTPVGVYQKYKDEGVPTDFAFSIRPNELDADDWCLTFDISRTSNVGVLIEKTVNVLRKEKSSYSMEDIITAFRKDQGSDKVTVEAAVNRFENANSWGLFDIKGTELNELVIGGKVTILDVSAYATMPNGWPIKSLVIGLIAKKLFAERMKARRTEEFKDIQSKMEYFRSEEVEEKKQEPLVWLVIDEAHEFLPREGKTTSTDPLVTILREGRQPGLSLILATQQPGKIHTDVMTQSDIIMSLRLTAEIDMTAMQQLAQSYLRGGIEKAINELPRVPGAAIIIDDANERLYSMRVRPRITWHGGEAPFAIPEKKKVLEF